MQGIKAKVWGLTRWGQNAQLALGVVAVFLIHIKAQIRMDKLVTALADLLAFQICSTAADPESLAENSVAASGVKEKDNGRRRKPAASDIGIHTASTSSGAADNGTARQRLSAVVAGPRPSAANCKPLG
jgi:hypothetical protein